MSNYHLFLCELEKDATTDLSDEGFEHLTTSLCVLTSKITLMLSVVLGAVGCDCVLQLYTVTHHSIYSVKNLQVGTLGNRCKMA